MAFSLEQFVGEREELPDEFYELTVADARRLHQELRARREELEQQPLQTRGARELEQSVRVLRHMAQYGCSVLRVQLQDRTVLQGTFRPTETVGHVLAFVRGYVRPQERPFYLYTTPPRCVLDETHTLADAGCVPSALLHLGSDAGDLRLREDLPAQFVSPSTASIAAHKLM